MKIKVTAVFDIGKTNKKFFLFDESFREIHREYIRFDEIEDEDGYPTENLEALKNWAVAIFDKMLDSKEYEIQALNFSCYGASLVHIDENAKPLTHLYNYMKPLKDEVLDSFYETHGTETQISRVTGSPKLGMLNAGIQLYWLKLSQPEVFEKIQYSLHLPQYLSYLFTGIPVSEYTSIGCHTMLWNFEQNDYHDWVYKEGIDKKLPPIQSSCKTTLVNYKGHQINIGCGIHDSSSALVPYSRSITKPFLLVSTGTWSISINPFNEGMLSLNDIENRSLFNMRVDGNPVKVSRLFLGNEYKVQVKVLSDYYDVPYDCHKKVKFDQDIFLEINRNFTHMFKWSTMYSEHMPKETTMAYDSYEYAYHQLLLELVLLQEKSIKAAIGKSKIKKLYIDGGFSDNEVYIQMLSQSLNKMKLRTANSSLGSALGAAIVISDKILESKFLKKNYAVKKRVPLNLK